jgi:hypothetical protein
VDRHPGLEPPVTGPDRCIERCRSTGERQEERDRVLGDLVDAVDGTLVTAMPRSVATSTAMLSTPTP